MVDGGVRSLTLGELRDALAAPDGFVWVDVPSRDPDGVAFISDVFGFDERAVADCARRNTTAKLHVYDDHAFVVDSLCCVSRSATFTGLVTGIIPTLVVLLVSPGAFST